MTMQDSTPLKEAGMILGLQRERDELAREIQALISTERYVGFTDDEVAKFLRFRDLNNALRELDAE